MIIKTEQEWKQVRMKYITASEAAVLVGLHPYSSPGKLKKESDFVGNSYTFVGQVLEPVVVEISNQILKSNFELYEQVKNEKMFFTRGNLGATPDAHENGLRLLECKSSNPDSYLKHIEDIPEHYLTQLQTQLWCTDIKEGYLAILSTDLSQRGQELKWPIVIYKSLRNDEFCNILEEESNRFFDGSKTYRVNSNTKKHCKALLKDSYERVFHQENNQKQILKELMRGIK